MLINYCFCVNQNTIQQYFFKKHNHKGGTTHENETEEGNHD